MKPALRSAKPFTSASPVIINARITSQPGSNRLRYDPYGQNAEMRGDYCASTRRTLVGQAHEHCAHQSRCFQAHTAAHHECERYEPRTNVRSEKLLLASIHPKIRSPNHRLRKAQSPTAVAGSAMS